MVSFLLGFEYSDVFFLIIKLLSHVANCAALWMKWQKHLFNDSLVYCQILVNCTFIKCSFCVFYVYVENWKLFAQLLLDMLVHRNALAHNSAQCFLTASISLTFCHYFLICFFVQHLLDLHLIFLSNFDCCNLFSLFFILSV